MSETAQFTSIIGFMILLSAVTAGIYIPALPEMERVFHVHHPYIKFSITIYFMGAMAGSLGIRPFILKYGHKRALRIFLLVFLMGSLICAFSLSIDFFLIGRFIQGVGIISAPVIGLALTADRYERENYRHIIAFILVLLGIGTGLSHLVGIIMIGTLHWEHIFYLLFFLGLIAFALSYYIPKAPEGLRQKHIKRNYRKQYAEHSGLFLYYQSMIGALEGALYAFLVVSPYILRVRYGWTLYEFSVLGVTLGCTGIIGAYLNTKLRSILGTRGMVLIGLCFLLSSFIFLFFLDQFFSPSWLVVNMALLTLGSGFILENLVSQVLKYFPRLTKLSSSLIVFSKISACAFVIGLVLFLPENETTMSYFILFALLICAYGYIKIRGRIFPPKR